MSRQPTWAATSVPAIRQLWCNAVEATIQRHRKAWRRRRPPSDMTPTDAKTCERLQSTVDDAIAVARPKWCTARCAAVLGYPGYGRTRDGSSKNPACMDARRGGAGTDCCVGPNKPVWCPAGSRCGQHHRAVGRRVVVDASRWDLANPAGFSIYNKSRPAGTGPNQDTVMGGFLGFPRLSTSTYGRSKRF
jgi:hypothetical protein